MKIVHVRNRHFKISFRRQVVTRFVRGHGTKPMLQTTCLMAEIVDDKESCHPFHGSVVCNYRDQDVRKRGYKHALAKALKSFNKTDRAKVWSQMRELFV